MEIVSSIVKNFRIGYITVPISGRDNVTLKKLVRSCLHEGLTLKEISILSGIDRLYLGAWLNSVDDTHGIGRKVLEWAKTVPKASKVIEAKGEKKAKCIYLTIRWDDHPDYYPMADPDMTIGEIVDMMCLSRGRKVDDIISCYPERTRVCGTLKYTQETKESIWRTSAITIRTKDYELAKMIARSIQDGKRSYD